MTQEAVSDGLGRQTGQHGGQKPRERLLVRYSNFRPPGQKWKAYTDTHGTEVFGTSREAWDWLATHVCDQPVASVMYNDTCRVCGGLMSRHEMDKAVEGGGSA